MTAAKADYAQRLREWPYPIIAPYRVGNIYVEPTNHCNLRCAMCARSHVTQKKGMMDWDLFTQIIDDVCRYNPQSLIQLYYVGEPFLHPRIMDMIRLIKRRRLKLHISTNGTLLSETIGRALIEVGVDSITFSFDAPDKNAYETARKGADYESTYGNIMAFLSEHRREDSDTRVVIEIIEFSAFQDKIAAFRASFEGLPCEVRSRPMLGWAGLVDYRRMAPAREVRRDYPCNRPWRMLAITFDGLYLGCCVDYARKCVLGDAHHESIEQVWNGQRMQRFRQQLKNLDYDSIELCRRCDDLEILSQNFFLPEIEAAPSRCGRDRTAFGRKQGDIES